MELDLRTGIIGLGGVVNLKSVEVGVFSQRCWFVLELEGGGGIDVILMGDKGRIIIEGTEFKTVKEAVGRIEGIIEDAKGD